MKRSWFSRPCLALLIYLFAALSSGCADAPPDAVTPDGTVVQSRLKAVHWLYTTFHTKKKKAPGSAEELNAFGEALPTQEGGPVSLTDAFLTSPRDQNPLVVHYGLDIASPDSANKPLAHEQDGYNGRRFVVFAGSGVIEEVDESRFAELAR